MKPIFIPLKRQYFEAFRSGRKRIEYRKVGGQFTEANCSPGREVTLSLGYGTRNRFRGTVLRSWVKHHDRPTGEIADCYGTEPIEILAIEILVDRGEARRRCNCQDISIAKRWASFIKRSGICGKVKIIRKGAILILENLSRTGQRFCDVIHWATGPSQQAIAQAKRYVGIVDVVQLIIPGMEAWIVVK